MRTPQVEGLTGSIALYDEDLDRMLFVTSDRDLNLDVTRFPVGENVTTIATSPDKEQLFVLSKGVFPRIEVEDEGPQLIVFSGGTTPQVEKTFLLDDPMSNLSLDPKGEWVAAFGGDSTVTNPNELVLLELQGDNDTPRSKTIRSFGGAPLELTFTEALAVPEGSARRFMIVRTDRDITLVDLANLDDDEVTIKLPQDENDVSYVPAQVVYDDGDEEDNSDARFAISLENSSDVVLLELGPADDEGKDFAVVVNIIDVGGVPSAIDFVRTDGGLRLAALVPGKQRATLVNPETTLAESVELPHNFQNMTRITSVLDSTPDGGDVALLWGENQSEIAFWSLGSTSSTPYRSVDTNNLGYEITSVVDVPAPNEHLKILEGAGAGFFVLDLKKRESFPLDTDAAGFTVSPSPDGQRLWVSRPQGNAFSSVLLDNLHPSALFVRPGVDRIFDIAQSEGGRAAVALHFGSRWSATVLDAEDPVSSETAFFPTLHLEGIK